MANRRKVVPGIFVPMFMGLIALYSVASKPRFETFHAVDVVLLIASGMCFGAALVALVMFFRDHRSN